MKDLSKEPLIDILKEIRQLDQQIDLLSLKYERLRLEVIKRFPQLENNPEFEPRKK